MEKGGVVWERKESLSGPVHHSLCFDMQLDTGVCTAALLIAPVAVGHDIDVVEKTSVDIR